MVIKTDQDTIHQYLFDASNFHGESSIVYIPESEDELSDLLAKCSTSGNSVSISGAGTGLTAGKVAVGNAVLSLEKFKKLEFVEGKLRVGVGCSWKEADEFARRFGYFIGPNPTEHNASIGGNIGTNASGSRTYKYGSFRDSIESLRICLAHGEVWEIDRGSYQEQDGFIDTINTPIAKSLPIDYINWPKTKNATGYKLVEGTDLIDILIGSEGTLAVTTECVIKCIPLSESLIGGIAFFEDIESLLDFVEVLKQQVLIKPRLIEYFDFNSLSLLNKQYPQIPEKAKGAIWFEEECQSSEIDAKSESWYNLLSENSTLADETWFATTDREHRVLTEFRHHLPEMIYENISKESRHKIGTDSAVPDVSFRKYFLSIHKKLEASDLNHVVFGHIGNSHLHANLFPENDEEEALGKKLYLELMEEAIKMGGTVSAEHGIGKLKVDYFYLMYGKENIKKMKKIKQIFDPNGILNPGNLFR